MRDLLGCWNLLDSTINLTYWVVGVINDPPNNPVRSWAVGQ